MLASYSKRFTFQAIRCFSTSKQNNYKVTVCGGAGGIGQPLSLLLKLNPLVSELCLYDVANALGVACDLSHINVKSKTNGYKPEELAKALSCADVVVIPAGVPRKPGMTRDDLFNVNAGIIKTISEEISKSCPKAMIAIITNPVNSCVPIAAEVLTKNKTYDPRRLFGVSTLDVVRAATFVGEFLKADPKDVKIPVIGGHSGVTIIPLLSHCKPNYCGSEDDTKKLTVRIQEGGTEVVKAKAGGGSATLSMAFAGARFVGSILRGLNGEKDVVECSYVESDCTEARFFATPVVLGKNGMEKNLGLPLLSPFETELLCKAMPELLKNIQSGVDFAKKC